jgi:hypothetical protein
VEKYGTARQATDGNIIRRMRFACWVTKATDTHSEHVIIIAFPREQWLRERPPVLRYKYIAGLLHLYERLRKVRRTVPADKPQSHARSNGSQQSRRLPLTDQPNIIHLLKPSGNFTYHQV